MTNIGFVSTGLGTYWEQFPGLLDHLTTYSKQISEHLKASGKDVAVIDAGLVDSAQSATSAAEVLASSRLELLFIYVSTYTLSSTVLPLAQAAGYPCILLNLQPDAKIDYKTLNSLPDRGNRTGLWVEYCQACSIPEIAGVLDVYTDLLKQSSTFGTRIDLLEMDELRELRNTVTDNLRFEYERFWKLLL